jgi:hypothetical protein
VRLLAGYARLVSSLIARGPGSHEIYIWKKWLSRRTGGDGLTWETLKAILRRHPLMRPRILHSWQGAGSHA